MLLEPRHPADAAVNRVCHGSVCTESWPERRAAQTISFQASRSHSLSLSLSHGPRRCFGVAELGEAPSPALRVRGGMGWTRRVESRQQRSGALIILVHMAVHFQRQKRVRRPAERQSERVHGVESRGGVAPFLTPTDHDDRGAAGRLARVAALSPPWTVRESTDATASRPWI